MNQWVLAGDVGGTKINLALFACSSAGLWLTHEASYHTQTVEGLSEVILEFMDRRQEKIAAACFGVAGPVKEGRAKMVNIRWGIDSRELAARCSLARVELINDLVATGYGINQLPAEAIVTLNKGSEHPTANGALLAAGTGLGQTMLVRAAHGWQPEPSEGGHADFAPVNDEQVELMKFVRRRLGGCDLERVLSGPGLVNIFSFLKETIRDSAPAEFDARTQGDEAARVISAAGLEGTPEIAVHALKIFIDVYAAAAANFALDCLAMGGVWLGGGIAPKILPALARPDFMHAFLARDRMRDLLGAIPVRVILEPKAALLGAAHCATKLLH